MIKYQFIGTEVLKAYTVVKCYKVIPGNNITIESTDNKVHSMPIGTVFSHVSSNPPAGAVLLSGQTLAKSDYTEFYNYINNNQNNIRVITAETDEEYEEAIKTYEAEIDQYGFCGAFVISENGVKLPTYTNAFLMGGNSTNNGTAVEAGLPNITGGLGAVSTNNNYYYIAGAFAIHASGESNPGGGNRGMEFRRL